MLRAVIAPLTERITAQILLVVPQHGVQPDGDAAIIFVDQLIVIAGHKALTLIVFNVFAG
ncbi:hypothetical protein D3C87_2090610 [compost metagenome]